MNQCKKIMTNPTTCAAKLKALADPTRLSVLKVLMDGPKYVNELVELLQIEQSLMSHHLQVLRKVGLVETVRDGKAISYQLPSETKHHNNSIQLGCCQLSFNEEKE